MTWIRHNRFEGPDGAGRFMPFGNIREGRDGSLIVAAYDCRMTTPDRTSRRSSSHLFASHDGGRSWAARGLIGEDFFTETDILASKNGWIAVVRTLSDYTNPDDPHSQPWVRLFRGSQDGRNWKKGINLTLPSQHPGHLLRLANGGILFTCGSRIPGFLGVFGRASKDEGDTWSDPFVLVDDGLVRDLGYPSTIQLDDDSLLTAYYAKETRAHHSYHMGVVRWNLVERRVC